MRLKDRQIEVFQAVMECGTLTAAAERLCISQPSVSRTLSRFEQVAGFQAFELKSGRLKPTEGAKIFYAEVVKVRKGNEYLTNVAKEIGTFRKGYISIAVFPAISHSWIVQVVKEFSNSYPEIQLSILEKTSKDIVESINTQRIDLGISMFKSDSDATSNKRISSIENVCILPKSHPLAEKKYIQLSDLKNEKFIGLVNSERGPILSHKQLFSLTESNNINISLNASSATMACHLVSENQGISIISSVTAQEHSHLKIETRHLKPKEIQPIYMLKSINRDYFPLIEVLEKMILEKLQEKK
jgi:DNA-binding transcriptional LysR family regulator